VTSSSRARVGHWIAVTDAPEFRQKSFDAALLIVRLAVAWIFIYYGAGKLFGAFNGPGLNATATFFATTAHLHPGKFFAVLSGVTEFFGGITIGLGLLGRLAALALFGDMVIAMATVTFTNGLIGSTAGVGYGLNVALAALCAAVVLVGSGGFSVDAILRARLAMALRT
jgi:putative oxidoreductase